MRRLLVLVALVFTLEAHAVEVILVSDESAEKVLRFSAETGAFFDVYASNPEITNTEGLVIGREGKLYVVDGALGVFRFDGTTGAFIDHFVDSSGSGGVISATFGPDGHLYVAGNHFIRRYDGTTGAFMDVFGTSFDGQSDYYYIVFGPDGKLYASSRYPNRVERFDGTTGAFIDVFIGDGSTGVEDPRQILLHTDGLMYVVPQDSGDIRRFNPTTGAFIDSFASQGMSEAHSLWFGPNGDLFVTDRAGKGVLQFAGQTGSPLGVFASGSGLNAPTYGILVTVSVQCSNGIDDDGDGRVDYPDDRGCTSLFGTSEQGERSFDLKSLSLRISPTLEARWSSYFNPGQNLGTDAGALPLQVSWDGTFPSISPPDLVGEGLIGIASMADGSLSFTNEGQVTSYPYLSEIELVIRDFTIELDIPDTGDVMTWTLWSSSLEGQVTAGGSFRCGVSFANSLSNGCFRSQLFGQVICSPSAVLMSFGLSGGASNYQLVAFPAGDTVQIDVGQLNIAVEFSDSGTDLVTFDVTQAFRVEALVPVQTPEPDPLLAQIAAGLVLSVVSQARTRRVDKSGLRGWPRKQSGGD